MSHPITKTCSKWEDLKQGLLNMLRLQSGKCHAELLSGKQSKRKAIRDHEFES